MSTTTRLRTVSRTQGCTVALKSGDVRVNGVTLDFEEEPVLVHAFRRMVREQAYDVCELAVTTYLCAREHGAPITAIPVFLARGLHHGAAVQPAGTSLPLPDGLEDAAVAVNRGYTVTTGVWVRGILADDYGVDLARVTWRPSGDEHVVGYEPPQNVRALDGSDVIAAVEDGSVVAAVGVEASDNTVEPLIPDADQAAERALVRQGLYPINHLVAIRDDVLRQTPGLGPALFDAFVAAKRQQLDALQKGGTLAASSADRLHRRVTELTGEDPLPYGVEPNRRMLELLAEHALRQGILRAPVEVDELFDPLTHGLTG